MTPLIQCVPNFSEGRRPEVINAIVQAAQRVPGVRVADWSADPDHNRLVLTLVGRVDSVCAAALGAANAAIQHIDLTHHEGVHPRLGAIDVLPLVPLKDITLAECADRARALAHTLSNIHAMPVFLYEAASPETRTLPFVRKNAFHTLAPDFGPPTPHLTAGAAVVGARGPLIAWNVNLGTRDLRIAKTIATELRENGASGFPGVRALGLYLESSEVAQVSMNITRPDLTPLLPIFSYIARRAAELGATVLESEIIGALPGPAAHRLLADTLQARHLLPAQVLLENWPA